MAHMVERDNMVYCNERPWHGLGVQLNATDNASLEEVLNQKPIFGSDIIHRPAICEDGHGNVMSVPDSWVAIREYDNKALACVGEQQRQSNASPRRLLQSLQNIIGEGRAMIHTAMYLREGKVFIATCKLGSPIEVTAPNGTRDESIYYLVAATSFDGSMRTALYDTITRVVCNNTFMASLGGVSKRFDKIRHTSGHEKKLTDSKSEWAKVVQRYELFKRTVEIMARTPIADAVANSLFKMAFNIHPDTVDDDIPTRTKNSLELVKELYHGGKNNGNAPWVGSAYGVFNGLSDYSNHHMVVRGVRDSAGKISDTSESARARLVDSVLFGSGGDFNNRAFDLVTSVMPRVA